MGVSVFLEFTVQPCVDPEDAQEKPVGAKWKEVHVRTGSEEDLRKTTLTNGPKEFISTRKVEQQQSLRFHDPKN